MMDADEFRRMIEQGKQKKEVEQEALSEVEDIINKELQALEDLYEIPAVDKAENLLAGLDVEFEAEKLIAQLTENLDATREEWNAEHERMAVARKRRDEIQLELDKINRELAQSELTKKEINARGNNIKKEITTAEQSLALEKARKEREQAERDKLSTFEMRTAEAPWRTGKKIVNKKIIPAGFIEVDLAMPHQIPASDMIASAERSLLCDGVGLGKTLSCLMGIMKLDPGKVDPADPAGIARLVGGRNPDLNILYICPGEGMSDVASTVRNWSYYSPMIIGRKSKFEQETMLRNIIDLNLRGMFVIINYEAWAKNKNLLSWLIEAAFDLVVVDEAHHMKDTSTSTYQGISSIVFAQNICDQCGAHVSVESNWVCPNNCRTEPDATGYEARADLIRSVKYFVAMTGTLIMNQPKEAYASLHLARPDIFWAESSFKNRYCAPWDDRDWAPGAEARLAQETSGFYMRRKRTDTGVVLPKQSTYIHEIEIDKETYPLQYQILEDLRERAMIEIEETERLLVEESMTTGKVKREFPQMHLLALITRQRHATVWPGGITIKQIKLDRAGWPIRDDEGQLVYEEINIGEHYEQSAKIDRAMELYDELHEDGHIVVVVSQFLTALKEFRRRAQLRGARVGNLHGEASKPHREEVKRNMLRRNNEEPLFDVIVMHYKTGGEALNLTAATALIMLDEPWNEATEDQAMGRLDRTGQTEETQVHILRHVGPQESIDSWLVDIIERKKNTVRGWNNAVEYQSAFKKK